MNDPVPVVNIVVAVVVVVLVTLAMGQVVVFGLNKDTEKNLLLHKTIAYLGMGAAFYAIFLARLNFSVIGWLALAGSVIGIIFIGSMIEKYLVEPARGIKSSSKKKKPRRKTKPAGQAKSKGKPLEIPDFVFEWVGGVIALFWGLVLISPLLLYFMGDDRTYLEVVQSSWSSFARWYENP